MAKDRGAPQELPSWSRTVEWSLLAGVVIVLVLVFVRQVQVLQGQAELSAIKTTLGALRTALVIEHLRLKAGGASQSAMPMQLNPFELLQRHPVNYRGEMGLVEAAAAPAGSWLFDPVCACVGYVPLYAEWFDSPGGAMVAWYQVSGAPGPLQLTAKEAYVWQNEVMN
jgi:hypothetical protein